MPLTVAVSTFGGVNGIMFTTARLICVGAQERHLPPILGMLDADRRTPSPAIVFSCLTSLLMLGTVDVFLLINYFSFTNWMWCGVSISALIWLRYKEPDRKRPIKFPIALSYFFTAMCFLLTAFAIYAEPMQAFVGGVILLAGVPVYYLQKTYQTRRKRRLAAHAGRISSHMISTKHNGTAHKTAEGGAAGHPNHKDKTRIYVGTTPGSGPPTLSPVLGPHSAASSSPVSSSSASSSPATHHQSLHHDAHHGQVPDDEFLDDDSSKSTPRTYDSLTNHVTCRCLHWLDTEAAHRRQPGRAERSLLKLRLHSNPPPPPVGWPPRRAGPALATYNSRTREL